MCWMKNVVLDDNDDDDDDGDTTYAYSFRVAGENADRNGNVTYYVQDYSTLDNRW